MIMNLNRLPKIIISLLVVLSLFNWTALQEINAEERISQTANLRSGTYDNGVYTLTNSDGINDIDWSVLSVGDTIANTEDQTLYGLETYIGQRNYINYGDFPIANSNSDATYPDYLSNSNPHIVMDQNGYLEIRIQSFNAMDANFEVDLSKGANMSIYHGSGNSDTYSGENEVLYSFLRQGLNVSGQREPASNSADNNLAAGYYNTSKSSSNVVYVGRGRVFGTNYPGQSTTAGNVAAGTVISTTYNNDGTTAVAACDADVQYSSNVAHAQNIPLEDVNEAMSCVETDSDNLFYQEFIVDNTDSIDYSQYTNLGWSQQAGASNGNRSNWTVFNFATTGDIKSYGEIELDYELENAKFPTNTSAEDIHKLLNPTYNEYINNTVTELGKEVPFTHMNQYYTQSYNNYTTYSSRNNQDVSHTVTWLEPSTNSESVRGQRHFNFETVSGAHAEVLAEDGTYFISGANESITESEIMAAMNVSASDTDATDLTSSIMMNVDDSLDLNNLTTGDYEVTYAVTGSNGVTDIITKTFTIVDASTIELTIVDNNGDNKIAPASSESVSINLVNNSGYDFKAGELEIVVPLTEMGTIVDLSTVSPTGNGFADNGTDASSIKYVNSSQIGQGTSNGVVQFTFDVKGTADFVAQTADQDYGALLVNANISSVNRNLTVDASEIRFDFDPVPETVASINITDQSTNGKIAINEEITVTHTYENNTMYSFPTVNIKINEVERDGIFLGDNLSLENLEITKTDSGNNVTTLVENTDYTIVEFTDGSIKGHNITLNNINAGDSLEIIHNEKVTPGFYKAVDGVTEPTIEVAGEYIPNAADGNPVTDFTKLASGTMIMEEVIVSTNGWLIVAEADFEINIVNFDTYKNDDSLLISSNEVYAWRPSNPSDNSTNTPSVITVDSTNFIKESGKYLITYQVDDISTSAYGTVLTGAESLGTDYNLYGENVVIDSVANNSLFSDINALKAHIISESNAKAWDVNDGNEGTVNINNTELNYNRYRFCSLSR